MMVCASTTEPTRINTVDVIVYFTEVLIVGLFGSAAGDLVSDRFKIGWIENIFLGFGGK